MFSMEDYTPPKHGKETIDFDEFAADFSIPRWKARRLTVSMSHNENVETKIILG